MRIYYDETRKNIVLGTTSRLFATGSLIALADRGRVAVIYRSNNFRELYIKHNQVLREDGSPAGGTISAVIDYLNGEFNKSPFDDVNTPGNYVTYTKPLTGFSVVVAQAEHGVAVVNPVTVRNSAGKEVEVSVEIDTAQTVTITSNISLDGHYAVIS